MRQGIAYHDDVADASPPILSYLEARKPVSLGWGYFTLIALGSLALVPTAWMFPLEISGDSYAGLMGLFFGLPLLLAQMLFVSLPSLVFISGRWHAVPRWPVIVLLLLSCATPLVTLAGIVLSVSLPTTHGSHC